MVPTRNQFNTVSPLHSLMDEFLGEVTGNTRTVARQFRPAMDLKEDQGNFYALLELPGMEKEDVKIALDEDILTIKGEKKHEVEENEGAFKRIEVLTAHSIVQFICRGKSSQQTFQLK